MKRLLQLIAARWLASYLLVSYAVFVLLLVIWGTVTPRRVVENIATLIPFLASYLLVGVNLVACVVVHWGVVRRRCALTPPGNVPGVRVALAAEDVAAAARAARMRLRWLEPQRLAVLHRQRFAPAGTLLLHLGLLLLPVAFAASRATRFEGAAWILEGQRFEGQREAYTRVTPEGSFALRAPRVAFDVENVSAEFWGSRLFFTDLRALVRTAEGARWITMAQPLWRDGARVTMHGFNYAASYDLVGPAGTTDVAGELNVQLFPPGTEDSFALPGLPYRVLLRLYPDVATAPGRGAPAELDGGFALGRPLFHAAVVRGKRIVARGWLRPGEPLTFDGYRLSFPAVRPGGEIMVHRDWGYPILWLALLGMLAGAGWRMLFPACRLWLRFDDDGAALAILRDDAFAGGRGARLLAGWSAA